MKAAEKFTMQSENTLRKTLAKQAKSQENINAENSAFYPENSFKREECSLHKNSSHRIWNSALQNDATLWKQSSQKKITIQNIRIFYN